MHDTEPAPVVLLKLLSYDYKMTDQKIYVIGGGLAGSEAAWRAAHMGVKVELFEMKPDRFSPAHTSESLAELVCSNSFRSNDLKSAVGLLKEEMRRLNSLTMLVAEETRVPAGGALAVDRELFAGMVTMRLESLENVTINRTEVIAPDFDGPIVVASGPLTSEALSGWLAKLVGADHLHFYDATSPIVTAESIDMDKAFIQSRYGEQGEGDYINCPLSEEEYIAFYDELMAGEMHPLRSFEKPRYFEGCLPIEVMAERGLQTLTFGPMKPVGLTDPKTGRRAYAVVQLRRENKIGTLYNMVGFQTRLKWGEQDRVFRLIPALKKANFVRYGSVHRNTFINGPQHLTEFLNLKKQANIFLAGQVSGVEGYVESAAIGILAGENASRTALGLPLVSPPTATAHGALITHLTDLTAKDFQPMNVNFGLFPPAPPGTKKKDRKAAYANRALRELEDWVGKISA